uniref:Uncharacterized protein n=1 Tax=Candidatus Methanogaster sp. ANME-2c ERB4 TaxID=2759911 RepID=A0A7G9YHL0_9EURY|nr:hypothetical protein MJFALNKJ_00027 [Methanosarcinales archaeon ANME-2c ERB4]
MIEELIENIILVIGVLCSIFSESVQLSTIATCLAAILAIVFSISLLAVQIVSDKYTPRVLEYFKKNRLTKLTLFSFLLTIVFCILFLGIHDCDQSVYVIGFALFLVCCCVFVKYFYGILRIINPIELANLLRNECLKNVKKQNKEETENVIDSLGDIAIKTIQRNEETVTKKYIQTLYDVFDEFLKLKEMDPEKYAPIVNSYYGRDVDRNNILGCVLDQFFRIYKEAIFRKDDVITKDISDKIFLILRECLTEANNDVLVDQIIEAEYSFCKVAIENKDVSRFLLVQHIAKVLQINPYQKDRIKNRYLNKFVNSHFFRVNKLILGYDDFELFKAEINAFCLLALTESPNDLQERIKTDLHLYQEMHPIIHQNKQVYDEIEEKRNYLQFLIKYDISKNFENIKNFEKRLEQFEALVIKHLEKIKDKQYLESKFLREDNTIEPEKFEDIKREIDERIEKVREKIEGNEKKSLQSTKYNPYKLYLNSKIYKTFFATGAYILFKGAVGGIDSEKYLKELWMHTNPEDADGICYNKPPITFDPFWLTYLLFYGGKSDDCWFDDYSFEDFHGTTDYFYQYYLLCIAKTRGKLRLPSETDLEKMEKVGKIYELEELYEFSNDFILKSSSEAKYCDVLIEKSDVWEGLFKNNAKEILEKTKEWVNVTTGECNRLKSGIETILPLDSEKVSECKKNILESYMTNSEILELTEVKEFDEERDEGLDFIQIHQRPLTPKDCFIRPSFTDCSVLWFNIGNSVAIGEVEYIVDKILKNEKISRIEIKNSGKIFEGIKSAVNDLKKQNHNPSVIFIPLNCLNALVEQRPDMYDNLKIDEDVDIKVVHSLNRFKFNDVIILDKNVGIWTFKPDENTKARLIVEISDYEKDKCNVDLLVKTVVNFRIVDHNAIKILELYKET